MALRYCFEEDLVRAVLAQSEKNDLAVIDSANIPKSVIQSAVKRGVHVWDYLNIGALESERNYAYKYNNLRLAPYEGWDGEYWVDVTSPKWQWHIVELARQQRAKGCTGVYLDNTDIYYMCKEHKIKNAPSAEDVYKALESMVLEVSKILTVMPNGGDTFVKRFVKAHPNVIKTVNQEGVLYQDKKRQSKDDTEYYTEYLDWCRAKGIYIRGIEYPDTMAQAVHAKLYYQKHKWQGIYISWHKELRGD